MIKMITVIIKMIMMIFYDPFVTDTQTQIKLCSRIRIVSVLHQDEGENVSVHCREEGCIGLYIPDDQEISRGPRDVARAKPEGHL